MVLLAGGVTDDDLIVVLGGLNGVGILRDGLRETQLYWLRVWAARGLLWEWDDVALPSIIVAFCDESWRVREMAAKVTARHLLGDALEAVAELRADPVPRVRAAATAAVVAITAAGS